MKAALEPDTMAAMRRVRCPQCHTECEWANNPFRPFCSERCKLIDLGAWLDERYTIPGDPPDQAEEVPEAPAEPVVRSTRTRPA